MRIAPPLLAFSLSSLWAASGFAATYYVAPSGSDAASGTMSSPWGTFAHAMSVLQPGDTLYLKDGTYSEALDVTVSGTTGGVITIAALDDGKAIVETTDQVALLVYQTPQMQPVQYVEVDGIDFRNSGMDASGGPYPAIGLFGSSHVTLRRITARGSSGSNSEVISLAGANDSLIEDCAAAGRGRVVLNAIGCDHDTIRRCWMNWTGPDTGGGDTPNINQIYDSSYVTMENDIGLNLTQQIAGIGTWAHYQSTSHNTYKGNVVYSTAGDVQALQDAAEVGQTSSYDWWQDNVAILPNSTFTNYGGRTGGADHLTYVNDTYVGDGVNAGFFIQARPLGTTQVSDAWVENSSFLHWGTGISVNTSPSPDTAVSIHTSNNYYDVTTCLSGESLDPSESCNAVSPGYDTATYGKGAYLMVPPALKGKGAGGKDIGAEVLCRFQDGQLTGEPLWPWPMEDRIQAEFGVSATWESDGGIWKTLDGVDAGCAAHGDAGTSADGGERAPDAAPTPGDASTLDVGAGPAVDGGQGEDGGNGATGSAGSSSGCGCRVAPGAGPRGGAALLLLTVIGCGSTPPARVAAPDSWAGGRLG